MYLRAYCKETDLRPLYEQYCHHFETTLRYDATGCGTKLTEERFGKEISILLEFAPIPCIVADSQDRAIGAAVLYRRSLPARSYHLALTLFEQSERTQEALKEVLDEIFRIDWARMVICEVPACHEAWLDACRAAGMEEAGCVPDSYCREGKLYAMYTMIMRHQDAASGENG